MRRCSRCRAPGRPWPIPQVALQVEIATKYAGYIDRQHDEIARHLAMESAQLPADLDYRNVRGLSAEAQQKLNLHKPETIGQAARISGITPAAISLLLVHLKRGRRRARGTRRCPHDGSRDAATHDVDLAAGIAALGLALDAAQRAKLAAYLALLAKWNKTYNLTAIREPRAWSRIICSMRWRSCRTFRRRRACAFSTWVPAAAFPAFRSRSRGPMRTSS